MTVKEAVEQALKLIPDDREAEEVEINWSNDGTYNLTVRSSSQKVMRLTAEGLTIEPYVHTTEEYHEQQHIRNRSGRDSDQEE